LFGAAGKQGAARRQLSADTAAIDKLEEMKKNLEKLLRQYPGPCKTFLRLELTQRSETVLELPEEYKVVASDELLGRIEQLFGERVAVLR
jgi:hypothetical protein